MNSTAAGRVSERGYQGETGAFGPNRAFRACCPMASFAYFPSLESRPPEASSSQAAYRSARRKRQASFTSLLDLSPRRRKRHIPRFRRKAKARSFCCGSSPHERRPAFRGDPGFAPLGFGGGPVLSPKGIPLIRPLRGHHGVRKGSFYLSVHRTDRPPGEGRIRTRFSPRYKPSAGRWADAPAPWCPDPGR